MPTGSCPVSDDHRNKPIGKGELQIIVALETRRRRRADRESQGADEPQEREDPAYSYTTVD
jgi:hypothetical protein